jgi:predicted nucleic acid-binding protein
MKALLDTNVVLDAMTGRTGGNLFAQRVIEAAGGSAFQAYLTTNSVTDIYYILSCYWGASRAHEMMPYLFSLFSLISVNETDCYQAHEQTIGDFEDALLLVCAKKEKIETLVTSDKDLLEQNTSVNVVSPEDFLQRLETERKKR